MNIFHQNKKCNPYLLHFNENNTEYISEYNNTMILDLIDTLYYICYQDFYTYRDENLDNSKKLTIDIPVNNKQQFDKIIPYLNQLIQFMTNGEKFIITFSKQTQEKKLIMPNRLQLGLKFNSIALLSGGLDALAGASQEATNNTLFITFATNSIEKNKAINSYNYIKNLCRNSSHVIIPKVNINGKKPQLTQRTRSLAFIGSCLLYADYYKIKNIKIYENGIMTLNPVFYFRRRVTRTTHPKTLYLINIILKTLNINIDIINPFNFLTKADVLNLIPDDWNQLLSQTKTCSKMPGTKAFYNRNGMGINHCGICTACILRQISFFNSNKKGFDSNYMIEENVLNRELIMQIEKKIGYNKSKSYITSLSNYRFLEKKSLIDYYNIYKKMIDSKKIYQYLYLNPKYFEYTPDYLEKYEIMLNKFSKEIDKYTANFK